VLQFLLPKIIGAIGSKFLSPETTTEVIKVALDNQEMVAAGSGAAALVFAWLMRKIFKTKGKRQKAKKMVLLFLPWFKNSLEIIETWAKSGPKENKPKD